MKILLSGLKGYMGGEVAKLCLASVRGAELLAGVDVKAQGDELCPCFTTFSEVNVTPDCVVDFSHASLTEQLLEYCVKNNLPLVLATTGQTPEQKTMIAEAAKSIPLFFAANYSMGVALLTELAKQTAKAFPEADIEIVETHHNRKADAPSGTALAIFNALKQVRETAVAKLGRAGMCKRTPEEIGIHAVRVGNTVGIHEVIVGTQNQTITLKHEAHSRALFAEGALAAAAFLMGRPAGLYDMNDLISGE